MAKVVVEKVEQFAKCSKAHLAGGTHVMFWNTDAFAARFVEGAELDLTVESRENKMRPGEHDRWAATVNGEAAKAKTGGGGGYKSPPRDESVIVAQCLFKGAVDVAIHNAAHDDKPRQIDPNEVKSLYAEYCAIFPEGYKQLKAAINA